MASEEDHCQGHSLKNITLLETCQEEINTTEKKKTLPKI